MGSRNVLYRCFSQEDDRGIRSYEASEGIVDCELDITRIRVPSTLLS